jgi:hypothetical protein
MKKIFLAILFSIGFVPVFSCSCVIIKMADAVAFADFIATARIRNVVPDSIQPQYKNVTIELINLYKGERITTLRVNTEDQTSCEFSLAVNSVWLFFAAKNPDGKIGFGACSASEQIDIKYPDSLRYPNAESNHSREIAFRLEVLAYLRDAKISPRDTYQLNTKIQPHILYKFQGANVTGTEFAIYALTVGTEMEIQNIRVLKELKDQKLRTELYTYLKSNLAVYQREKDKGMPLATELIFIVCGYPAEDGYPGFLSEYNCVLK